MDRDAHDDPSTRALRLDALNCYYGMRRLFDAGWGKHFRQLYGFGAKPASLVIWVVTDFSSKSVL